MRPVYANLVRSERQDRFKVECSRCGGAMASNSRVHKLGVIPLCRDCRESDPGLAYVWKREISSE